MRSAPLECQPRALMVGQMTGPLWLQPPQRVHTIGLRFRPGGLAPFVTDRVDLLTDRSPSLEDLWGHDGRSLEDQLRGTSDDVERLAIVAAFLDQRWHPWKGRAAAVDAAIGRLMRARGRVRVSGLARDAGLSPRQFERVFRERVGLAPKLLARVVRFQHMLAELARREGRPGGMAGLALECGYYDQAHFVRDFKQFAGVSPTAFVSENTRFARVFVSTLRYETLFERGHPGGSCPSKT
jgi:AraC-like DNA-binding protein